MYQEPYRDQDLPPNIELTTQHTVHRSASKAYSRPPDQHREWSRWALPVTTVIACLSLGVAVAAAVLLLSYKNTTQAQISQLTQAVANAQQGSQASTTALSKQAAQIRGIESALAEVAQFDTVCSTDLTGPNGPAQWDFACKLHPGG